ncbi:LytR C-terminal domain-containing protein [Streptomyces sp. 549]|uniref:LCP family protein n=1 Tax=Streptomyces sp. 549 TaxID=3049076 RepID=UPI0024C4548C|nr:LCP family protein [Streptomyces sp. 549]MDK1474375.1 LytR C-terminal domain-containing protein [Streptomyces sp. 549]
MNDRQDPYGEQQFIGYDEYGRPIYHDPYAPYDPYAAPAPPAPASGGQPDGRGGAGAQGYGYDGYPAPGGPAASYGTPDPYAVPGPSDGYGYAPDDGYTSQAGAYPTADRSAPYDQGAPYDPYTPQDPYPSPSPDPYSSQDPYPSQDPYASGRPAGGYDPYAQPAQGYGAQQAAQQAAPPQQARTGTEQQQWLPQQPQYDDRPRPADPPRDAGTSDGDARRAATDEPVVPAQRPPGRGRAAAPAKTGGEEYRTEEFSFIEEEDEESEDVIDWLKFSESRTERREEAKRKGRNRVVVLVVALAVALAGGVGYLWYAGKLPGLPRGEQVASGSGAAEKRDVIVVHLRDIDSGDISTALLVNNEGAGRGTTVLLPNALALATEDGTTTTLGKSFSSEGAGATRSALDTLFGSQIKGTWRLDTPYLENLVESVGGITMDADATVPGPKKGDKPLVHEGSARDLDGRTAVAYATHQADGEQQTAQLARFGQVMQAVLKKLSSDSEAATSTVESLGQIPDPSLSDAELGTALALLAEHAKNGDYDTETLPVESNGTISDAAAEGLVKKVLGGTVTNSDPDAALRVSLRNASGDADAGTAAQAALANGGYTVAQSGEADTAVATSKVTYTDEADRAQAEEVAKTLGLPAKAATKGKAAANADVTVVLGQDYEG